MRVLVTGGTGFIGSHLIRELVDRGRDVVTISRRSAPPLPFVEHHALDIEDPAVQDVAERADAIVHLAASSDASSSFANPFLYSRTNALGTLNVLEAARRSNALFVFASSQRIYRPQKWPVDEDAPKRPVDPYGYSKLIGEHWVQMHHQIYDLRTVVLRFFSVYGPGQTLQGGTSGVVTIFVRRAMQGEELTVNDGNLRDFTYVGDIVKGIVLALDKPAAIGQTYNIATGESTSIETLARTVKEIAKSTSSIVVKGTGDEESYVADIARARSELGYQPSVDLRRGLELYVEHLK
ncbi:MAG: NAD-dependent epimerase/dehydratase family protein [Chloroflexi bacterium]|nr:NAD-dependent epimerase/dehydratase family protein [Chloroflexota bacterium]